MSPTAVVEAAGGLLWRPGDSGPEVALVHRPKYDDWSLPKGKLEPGEHPLLGALREVAEETGAVGVPGRPLGQTRYVKDGSPKRVRYWAMRHAHGDFEPNAEVDELRWVSGPTARQVLEPDRDGRLLAEFLRDPRPTRAAVVVRHASAGDRATWAGPDDERPLDDLGQRQARGLAELLVPYQVSHAHCADVRRCRDTLGPFAARTGVPVDNEPLVSESGWSASPEASVARMLAIVQSPGVPVVCTQRGALPDLVIELTRSLGAPPPALEQVGKGSLVVLHLSDAADATDAGGARVVAVEQLPPVVTAG